MDDQTIATLVREAAGTEPSVRPSGEIIRAGRARARRRTAGGVAGLAVAGLFLAGSAIWLGGQASVSEVSVATADSTGSDSRDSADSTIVSGATTNEGEPEQGELPPSDPFRMATDEIAVAEGWTYRTSGQLGSAETPTLIIAYGIPDGREVTFTHEGSNDSVGPLVLTDEAEASVETEETGIEVSRGEDIPGVSGRIFFTMPNGERISAALVPPSVDDRTDFEAVEANANSYEFSLDDLEDLVRSSLIG